MLKSSDRKAFRFYIGDFSFDDFRRRYREPLYLERNLTRVLNHHQGRLSGELNRPGSGARAARTPRELELPDRPQHNSTSDASTTDNLQGRGVAPSINVQTSHRPIMASRLAAPGQQVEGESRTRGLRNFRERKENANANSELLIDLSNIRKKLNFKTNVLDEGERPAKRQKRDAVKCKCHLTIWDNRTGAHSTSPKAFTRDCRVVAAETATDGFFVDVELDSPFIIRNEDLMVTYHTKDGWITGLIDKYFMEIKIIPCRATNRWPPMPILGKSDGDHFAHDTKDDSGELQGAVVARYMHLPQAPDGDVPLSVFFLHEGRTYRTKYGLSVVSKWMSAGTNPHLPNGIDIDSFKEPEEALDSVVVQRRSTPKQKLSEPALLSTITLKSALPQAAPIAPAPEVRYVFSSIAQLNTQDAEKLRSATVKGYRCPICTMWTSTKLVNLEFHLATTHSKYIWSVQKPPQDPTRRVASCGTVEIEVRPLATPRKEDHNDRLFEFEWQAPKQPFNLPAYLEGDQTWCISQKKDLPPPKTRADPKKQASNTLPAAKVAAFRVPRRKKYPAIKLRGSPGREQPVYTSVSHRPVSPSEEPRSETDDEIDNDWQIQQHMERLDTIAKIEGWSDCERELRKRWDKHRMEEQLEHPRYLSNSLVRFVRKNRTWLSHGKDDLLQIFFDFLRRLKERSIIDDEIIFDVNEIIFNAPATRPSSANNSYLANEMRSPMMRNGFSSPGLANGFPSPVITDEQDRELERALRPNTLLTPQKSTTSAATNGSHDFSPIHKPALPRDACGICRKSIKTTIRNATFCTDPRCDTPRVMYHRDCAEDESSKEVSNGKGKAVDLQSWVCATCTIRKQAQAPDKGTDGASQTPASLPRAREGENANGPSPHLSSDDHAMIRHAKGLPRVSEAYSRMGAFGLYR